MTIISSHESSFFVNCEDESDSNVLRALSLVKREWAFGFLIMISMDVIGESEYVFYCASLFLTFSSNIVGILDGYNLQFESVL